MSAETEAFPWDDDFSEAPEDAVEIIPGRRAPFSKLGDWVLLAGASPQACKLYWIFVMHVNRTRGDSRVWPKREDLAAMFGASLDTVDRYSKELKKLGAINIIERRYSNRLRARNAYVVHETPPPGYTGRVGIDDFYADRK